MRTNLPSCLVAVVLAVSALPSLASDPIGVYAFVDKIVFEPNEAKPDYAQIWGGFALADGNGSKYKPAQRGYMYFKLKPEKESLCRNEWADLKSVAGTGAIVGFGRRYWDNGAVRKATAKPEKPDTYPIGMGVQKISATDLKPVEELNALKAKSPAAEKVK